MNVAARIGLLGLLLAALSACATQQGNIYSTTIHAEKNRQAGTQASSRETNGEAKADRQTGVVSTKTTTPTRKARSGNAENTPFSPGTEPLKISETDQNGSIVTLQSAIITGTRIDVTSTPSNAEVYVNGSFLGFTPLTMENPSAAAYVIRIVKHGYYTVERRIDLHTDTSVTMDVTLAPLTGFLIVDTRPADAYVYLDGNRVVASGTKLATGPHRVRISLFGYRDYVDTVDIEPEATTTLMVALKRAPFTLSNLSASRPRFNPHNPGPLGQSNIDFRVSSYGTATVTITAKRGPGVVRTFTVPAFQTWRQQVTWKGRDQSGHIVKNGTYLATVVAAASGGKPVQTLSVPVAVDSSLEIRYRAMVSGLPGLAYAPIADILPQGTTQIGSQFIGHIGTVSQSGIVARFPLMAGIRYGVGYGVEADATAQGILNTDPTLNDGSVTLGGRWKYLSLRPVSSVQLGGALQLKGTFLSHAATDTLTNFDGFSLSAPVSLEVGPIGLTLSPEILASSYPVYPVVAASSPGLYLWGYGRAGVFLDTPTVLAGISAAVRTVPMVAPPGTSIPEGWLLLPMEVAAEAHVMLPGTSFVVSFTSAAEISSLSDYYVLAGGGLAFLY